MTPDEFTNQEFFLDVGNGHRLYVHDWGNPKAKVPILLLHGGPGDGTKDGAKILFNSSEQRVIFFDQRGAGRSLPYGSREHNTTPKLISDIEKIRNHLGVSEIILAGGSWGSMLALCYAIAHPKQVKGMVISGIWTGTQDESAFIDEGQVNLFFPEVWQRYLERTPAKYRSKPTAYHFKKALHGTAAQQKASSFAYQSLVYGSLQLNYYPSFINNYAEYEPSGFQIAIHYLADQCFLPDNYIQKNIDKLTMPVWMVQGRYDMICPPITAYRLNEKLPNSRLMMAVAGHRSEHETWNLMRTLLLQMATPR
jgi:proline iminopeptidase